ncbi:hypothetical protein ANAPC1_01426 [Anaplasma phagocytophilum]|uniref:Uncharacterized protein n=1 Tax=Anaplasma phagocytophilum TaxID=948 RepID=A0AA45UV02_ANAPH|nr:hypothetical protein [Anaplasma phagocytophilum]SBO15048.1 hypothetical protein ANAPC1_01426 [Anaplasma phagocytophilum]SBO32714.1 hypothetical protein ANAPC2_01122 [Anaplasma phagocytophilum]SBO33255.1 hypothetical protein ANAPC3_01154 [Anaplasma phagocytophilum]SBO33284.1 hypothetical protein ANAPC4_01101 [Anaplasma phagocytophilum]SCV65056.1 hypothetical protein ANAPC5_01040 [Anaplasma phagocytophilum]
MEISAPKIDDKVCETKSAATGGAAKYATYKEKTEQKSGSKGGTALCSDEGYVTTSSSISDGHSGNPQALKDFVKKTLKEDGNGNWPTSTAEPSGTPTPETNDNAKAVAGDLTKLTTEEKTIVAGLLAKTIEGGEVVERCLSTSA